MTKVKAPKKIDAFHSFGDFTGLIDSRGKKIHIGDVIACGSRNSVYTENVYNFTKNGINSGRSPSNFFVISAVIDAETPNLRKEHFDDMFLRNPNFYKAKDIPKTTASYMFLGTTNVDGLVTSIDELRVFWAEITYRNNYDWNLEVDVIKKYFGLTNVFSNLQFVTAATGRLEFTKFVNSAPVDFTKNTNFNIASNFLKDTLYSLDDLKNIVGITEFATTKYSKGYNLTSEVLTYIQHSSVSGYRYYDPCVYTL